MKDLLLVGAVGLEDQPDLGIAELCILVALPEQRGLPLAAFYNQPLALKP